MCDLRGRSNCLEVGLEIRLRYLSNILIFMAEMYRNDHKVGLYPELLSS